MTQQLSPAAQSVWNAYEKAECDPYLVDPRRAELAAALRAIGNVALPANARGMADRQKLRSYILSIANELEAQ